MPAGSEQEPRPEDDDDDDDGDDDDDADDADIRNNRRPHPLGKEASAIYDDARPYASTNVIHRTPTQRNAEILSQQDRHRQRQTATSATSQQQQQQQQQQRGMRFFGDTDVESQQSSRYRYAPKTKVTHRSASNAAGMTSARR